MYNVYVCVCKIYDVLVLQMKMVTSLRKSGRLESGATLGRMGGGFLSSWMRVECLTNDWAGTYGRCLGRSSNWNASPLATTIGDM